MDGMGKCRASKGGPKTFQCMRNLGFFDICNVIAYLLKNFTVNKIKFKIYYSRFSISVGSTGPPKVSSGLFYMGGRRGRRSKQTGR